MSGQYWCGLDDDDIWIDRAYLSRTKESIEVAPLPIDAYFAQQRAIADGTVLEKQLLDRGNWYLCYTKTC